MSSGNRIAFERGAPSCVVCDARPPEGGRLAPVTPSLVESSTELLLCAGCRAQLGADGPEPPPFLPEFHFDGALRLPVVTDDDLRALLSAVAGPATSDAELTRLLDCAGGSTEQRLRMADHEAWSRRVLDVGRPQPVDVAGWLVSAAVLGVVAAPLEEVDRLRSRARGGDELGLCVGAYAVRAATGPAWQPAALPSADGRTRRLLEWADRALLTAMPVGSHPLADRATWMRLGVAILLGREVVADGLLDRLGRDAPRSQLLRGARLLQQGNVGAADREFRAAAENPFAGFDAEIDAAAIWNRTMRAMTATRVDEARDALRAYCRLRPHDLAARLLLGHAWLRAARPEVAREVLGSILDATAVEHLRDLAETDHHDVATRTEGRLLYVSCLLRLGDVDQARKVLAPEFEELDGLAGDGPETSTPRRPERLRLAARVARARGADDQALELLRRASAGDESHALAGDVARVAGAIVRERLDRQGLPGLFEFAQEQAWVGKPLLRHFSAAFAHLLAAATMQQVEADFRPLPGFGLDWSVLGKQGATALVSQYQACACLVRHQFARALQHDQAAIGASSAPLPWATLTALWRAAHRADAREREVLSGLLALISRQWQPPTS